MSMRIHILLLVVYVGQFCPEAPNRICGSFGRNPHFAAHKSAIKIFCLQLRFCDTHTEIHNCATIIFPDSEQFKCAQDIQLIEHVGPQWICATHLLFLLCWENSRALKTIMPQLQSWGGGKSITVHFNRPNCKTLQWMSSCGRVLSGSNGEMGNSRFSIDYSYELGQNGLDPNPDTVLWQKRQFGTLMKWTMIFHSEGLKKCNLKK